MSVLIKGVDMPKGCVDCPCFYDYICCNALPYGEGAFSDHKGFDEYDGRLPNCPLVEVSEIKSVRYWHEDLQRRGQPHKVVEVTE